MTHQHSSEDKIRITRFFNDLHKQYGQHSARALGWESRDVQQLRFAMLTDIADLEGANILDVGCGLGDLYAYLKASSDDFAYVGIDITPGLVHEANHKYPDADIRLAEIFDFADNSFDYVFASGVFSYTIPDYLDKYFQIINKMYTVATKGVAFNMLNKAHHDIDDFFMAYAPEEIAEMCTKITKNVVLHKNYMPQDFTIYLYR